MNSDFGDMLRSVGEREFVTGRLSTVKLRPVKGGEKVMMRKFALLMALFAGVFLATEKGYAHHSFAATYFEDKKVTVEGELVQFLYRNPHSFIQVESKEKDGTVIRWAVEWGGGGQLSRQGVTRETLKPGDHVVVVGNPGRNDEDHRLRMVTIERPSDGWKWGGTIE